MKISEIKTAEVQIKVDQKPTYKYHYVRIYTDEGIYGTGEASHVDGGWRGSTQTMAQQLIGKDPRDVDACFEGIRRSYIFRGGMAGLGISALTGLEIALWDLAGKYYEAPLYELLGGTKKKLPCYASTFVGDHNEGGLNTAEAYAEFAQDCLDMGYPAFKIHGWQDATIQKQIDVVHAVGNQVGGKMDLMLDPFCAINTFGEALKIGWACDEHKYFWLEDPFKDGGVSAHAHRKLRQLIKTPLLQLEHIRGLESHVDFIVNEATDFVRADPDYDGGVTGVMKIAHAAEGFGLDVELHSPGPVRRHLMASIRNTNYYEMGLLHPKVRAFHPEIYKNGYSDELDSIDQNGFVDVPDGHGLGVEYDWDFIDDNTIDKITFTN